MITAEFSFLGDGTEKDQRHAIAVFAELVRRVAKISGVQSASAVTPVPMSAARPIAEYGLAGDQRSRAELPGAEAHVVEPRYFETMRIALKAGRDFDARDTRDAPPVVIVNETLARSLFADGNSVGKQLTTGMTDNGVFTEHEIVGVVADTTSDSLDRDRKRNFTLRTVTARWPV